MLLGGSVPSIGVPIIHEGDPQGLSGLWLQLGLILADVVIRGVIQQTECYSVCVGPIYVILLLIYLYINNIYVHICVYICTFGIYTYQTCQLYSLKVPRGNAVGSS